MKAMLKSELAELAGVSNRTFGRWLSMHRDELSRLGISHAARLIPPIGVKFICDTFDIDLP